MSDGRFRIAPILRSCLSAVTLLAASSAAAAAPADPAGCLRGLAAVDADGQVVFETVALLTGPPGVAAAPLHPLERGGVRWSRLILRPPGGGSGTPVDAVNLSPNQDLA